MANSLIEGFALRASRALHARDSNIEEYADDPWVLVLGVRLQALLRKPCGCGCDGRER